MKVRIFEVGPRDGLQNEKVILPTAEKARFVRELVDAGARDIEVGAFVRPDRVPQMADTFRLYKTFSRSGDLKGPARFWALVPNRKGLEGALASGSRHIAVFTAATESFAKRNIGMSIGESLREFEAVIREAKKAEPKIRVRGYVSTAFGCPFEGAVKPSKALRVIEKLAALGVDQISIGDTIGVANPRQVDAVVAPALKMLGQEHTAVHFHDTRGTALANALRSLELGVATFDSSAGGLGGCPFAPSATGNLATEDLLFMFHGMGIKTGLDLEKYCRISVRMARRMKRPLTSRYLQAWAAACAR